jgi:hypothetical protein
MSQTDTRGRTYTNGISFDRFLFPTPRLTQEAVNTNTSEREEEQRITLPALGPWSERPVPTTTTA